MPSEDPPKASVLRGHAKKDELRHVRLEVLKPVKEEPNKVDTGKVVVEVMGWEINAGYLSLAVLVIQNSSLVLMTRYSTAHRVGPQVQTGFMILCVELVKMVFCCMATLYEIGQADPSLTAKQRVVKLLSLLIAYDTFLLAMPAGLFTLQNYLIFVSLANLDAMTFQILSQVKLFFAAAFSVMLLDRFLTFMQWGSICILVSGIILAGIAGAGKTGKAKVPNNITGMLSCLISGTSSSFAGVYFEKVLKGTPPSVAVRNVQLGVPAIAFSTLSLLFTNGGNVPFYDYDPLLGFDKTTMLLILNHAGGGVLVAVVVKYADNILKGFATGVAMIVSGAFSAIFWEFKPTAYDALGCGLVVLGTITYHSKYDPRFGRIIARQLPGGHRIPSTPATPAVEPPECSPSVGCPSPVLPPPVVKLSQQGASCP